jgi:hypothetical protein
MKTERLSLQEAYLAMFEFLAKVYERTKSDELGALLGEMSLLSDGTTADPAIWRDWLRCVEKSRRGDVPAKLKFMPPS